MLIGFVGFIGSYRVCRAYRVLQGYRVYGVCRGLSRMVQELGLLRGLGFLGLCGSGAEWWVQTLNHKP